MRTEKAEEKSVNEGANMDSLHEILIEADYGSEMFAKSIKDILATIDGPLSIDLMLENVHRGNLVDGVFRKRAWLEMIVSVNAKFGFNYEIDMLENQYRTLRRQYNVDVNLLGSKGILWDDKREMVTTNVIGKITSRYVAFYFIFYF